MDALLDTPMPEDVEKRRRFYRENGLVGGRSVEPKRGRRSKRSRAVSLLDDEFEALDDEGDVGIRLASAGDDPSFAAVHAGAVTLQPKAPGVTLKEKAESAV
eukprot:48426-Alexandrium_andersonii.AAC.1